MLELYKSKAYSFAIILTLIASVALYLKLIPADLWGQTVTFVCGPVIVAKEAKEAVKRRQNA